MKIKRRKVANAIDNLREDNQISYEIRGNAAAHSKAISKLLNTEGAIKNSPKVYDIIHAILPGQKNPVPIKNADVRTAVLLIEKIAARLVPDRKVRLNVEDAFNALEEATSAVEGERPGGSTLSEYFDAHFDFHEQYLECRFNHDGRQYSLEVTDDRDDYLRFHLFSAMPGSRAMSEHYDVYRHSHELDYSHTIDGNMLKAAFRGKKSHKKMFSITLSPDSGGDFAASADLSISEKLLKSTNKRFKGKKVGCSIEFVD